MSGRRLSDAAARDAAVTTFDRNVVVVAGAGTGKTSLLVERLLVAVGADRVGLRQVAAMTFTEKAAGEMRERLAEGLERLLLLAGGRIEPDPTQAADRAWERLRGEWAQEAAAVEGRASRALEDLEGASLTTVHGFCAEILRTFPMQAEVPPSFEVDAGERAKAVFDEEWGTFVAKELGPDAPREALWVRLLRAFPLSTLASLAREFAVDEAPADLLANGRRDDAARNALGRICSTLAEEIEDLLARAPDLHAKPRAFFVAAARTLREVESNGPGSLANRDAALDRKGAPTSLKSAPEEVAEALANVGKRAFDLLSRLQDVDEAIWSDAVDAVRPFVTSMRDALAARGLVGFQSLLVRTRDLLRDRPDVRERLKARWSMLLLDEFQDTDPLQYEIVLFLAERAGESARDPFRANLEPGRLFVVGDPKQSIYRFRGADYAAFVRAVETIRGDDSPLDLTANFRSRPGLLEAVNRLFAPPRSSIWNESREGDPFAVQPRYTAVTPGTDAPERAEGGPSVEVLTVDAGEGVDAQARRIAEGRVLASEILRLRGSEADFAFRDVLVLLRTFSNVSLYVRALRRAGIPFVVDGGKSFFDRTEVTQLLAVLRAMAVPDDPVALLAYLRSPAGGVDDVELDRWAAAAGEWTREELPDPAAFPRLSRALERLRRWAREIRDLPADRAIAHVLERSALEPFGAFAYEGSQRVANLRKLAGVAMDLARDGSLSFAKALEAVAEGTGSDVESESPLADERTDAVRLLTIHKAKGLEARFVFVGDLARKEGSPPPSDDLDMAACTFPVGRALAASSRAAGVRNTASVVFEIEKKAHERAERTRLLYVAATRARERLVLLAAQVEAGTEPPWLEALEAWGYRASAPPGDGASIADGLVRHRIVRDDEPVPIPSPPSEGLPAPEAFAAAVAGARGAAVAATFRRASELPSWHDDAESDAVSSPVADRSVALAVGSVVHQVLERWPEPRSEDLDARVEAISREQARLRGVDPDEVALQARSIVTGFARGPFPSRLEAVTIVAREMPLLWQDEEGLWKGVADFVYRGAEDRLVVADWKTDADSAGAVDRYGAQMRRYAGALRLSLGLETAPRAELWMVRSGEVLVVPPETSER